MLREFVMDRKLAYEKQGLIPTLDLLISDLDESLKVEKPDDNLSEEDKIEADVMPEKEGYKE